ncbi:MAG TPA: transposase, partial [Anaerolineales bacterium]|nr:transposase [Anaerolineales bacterium]
MPNHVHGIVVINDVGVGFKPTPTSDQKIHGLSEIVRGFKTYSSRQINAYQNTPGQTVWQRGYWDRAIRDDEEFNRIREYIQFNPCQRVDDDLYTS